MRIEAVITGLPKAKRAKLTGLKSHDGDACEFEWRADEDPPHDYATAISRVTGEVERAGGEVISVRPLG